MRRSMGTSRQQTSGRPKSRRRGIPLRTVTWIVLPGMVLTGLWLTTTRGEGVEAMPSPGAIQLELPELGELRYAPGVLRIPEPEKIRRLVLHIPLTRIHQAFPKINTIG